MDSLKGKLKIIVIIILFLLIIVFLVGGLVYILFQSNPVVTNEVLFTGTDIPVTKFPLITPIDYSVVE